MCRTQACGRVPGDLRVCSSRPDDRCQFEGRRRAQSRHAGVARSSTPSAPHGKDLAALVSPRRPGGSVGARVRLAVGHVRRQRRALRRSARLLGDRGDAELPAARRGRPGARRGLVDAPGPGERGANRPHAAQLPGLSGCRLRSLPCGPGGRQLQSDVHGRRTRLPAEGLPGRGGDRPRAVPGNAGEGAARDGGTPCHRRPRRRPGARVAAHRRQLGRGARVARAIRRCAARGRFRYATSSSSAGNLRHRAWPFRRPTSHSSNTRAGRPVDPRARC